MLLQVFVEQLGRREVKFLAVYDMNASSNDSDESRKSRLVMALENITLVTSIKSNRCYESEIVEVRSSLCACFLYKLSKPLFECCNYCFQRGRSHTCLLL